MTLPATTIVETVTAALLVMVSLAIGMMIFLNVLASEQVAIIVKAQAVLGQLAEDAVFRQRFITETIEMDGFQVEKIITLYDNEYPDAVLMSLEAYNKDKTKKLCEIKKIIYPYFQQ